MTKISIIIPVYNSASFLEDCARSLLQQSFSDFEIWFVDDGSTDESGRMCDQYALDDQRVHVLHTENHGAAHARQMGIERASGEYLFFVDSDDAMPLDGLERMYQVAKKHPASDIIVGFCRSSYRWGRKSWTPRQYRTLLIEGRHNIGTLWGKLFRRTLFEKGIPTLPSHLVMGEDMLINIYLAFATQQNVQKVRGKSVYHYIQRDGGISRGFRLTARYESDFHEERLHMIPESAHVDYMSVLIHRRLRMLRRLYRYALQDHSIEALRQSDFVKQLAADINQNQYSFWSYPRPFLWKLLGV